VGGGIPIAPRYLSLTEIKTVGSQKYSNEFKTPSVHYNIGKTVLPFSLPFDTQLFTIEPVNHVLTILSATCTLEDSDDGVL
jgi:hypothetical protein